MKKITFFGARWCAPCHQLRARLDIEKLDYKFFDVDEKQNEEAMLEASGGRYLIPTIVIGDGEKVFQNPTLKMVQEALKA